MDKNQYLCDLADSDRVAYGKIPFVEQSEPQKVFSAIWAVEGEVANGGFLQYFGNSSSETAAFAPEAFRTIGAPKMAEIVEAAVRRAFPDGVPEDEDARIERVEEIEDGDESEIEEFESLSDKFSDYPEDLTELLYDYVQKHPDEFGT